MTVRRITRDRRLTSEEAAKYREVREQAEEELPELIARHGDRMTALDELEAGLRPNPTIETLARYAEAVGKRIVVSLADA